jgi:transposase
MLTGMTEDDWSIVLEVFDALRTRSGEPGRHDREFLEALHYFMVHNVKWRALPREFGKWNSVLKRFWRLSTPIRKYGDVFYDRIVRRDVTLPS